MVLAVEQVHAAADVDAAVVLDLGHPLHDQVQLVEHVLVGAVVVADRAVEAVRRVARIPGEALVEPAADVDAVIVQDADVP